jgi:phosphatidylglycerol:prolipoprotein diacylglycerol transferase
LASAAALGAVGRGFKSLCSDIFSTPFMVAYFFWNPNPIAFKIPYLDVSIYWYSLFFAIGFYGAVLITRSLIVGRAKALCGENAVNFQVIDNFVEKLSLYCFGGMLLGARLGHVLFYDAAYYTIHPAEIFQIWHGGLSSHGATVGLLLALWLFSRKTYTDSYLPRKENLLDVASIASAFAAFCIRCGNFFNQEIIGTQTFVPWAVIFGTPVDGLDSIPRHPVQLYEAFVSLLLLIGFCLYGRKGRWASSGKVAGLYLCLTFSSRMILEAFKAPVCAFDASYFHMGQLLSLPFIGLGVLLMVRASVLKSKERIAPRNKK